jgi:actin-related protein
MKNAIVVDNGTGHIKAGFSGDDNPLISFPTVVGIPKAVHHDGMVKKDF